MNAYSTRLAATLILTLGASPAFAQATTPRTGNPPTDGPPAAKTSPAGTALRRGYLSINGGYQATSNDFTNSWSLPYYLETESLRSSYSVKPGALIDVGAGVRVWRDLALGVAVSRYHRADFALLSATVPNPLLYNQPRTFTGTAAGPSRTETAVHANAMWLAALAPKIQLGLFGGPSFFSVKQVAISAVDFAETYPYTTVTVANTATQSQTKSSIGFNAGGDLTVLLHKLIGVGMLFRYTGMKGQSPVPSIPTAPNAISPFMKAGGLQVGGGLRFRF